jgi:Transglycosylase-like domain
MRRRFFGPRVTRKQRFRRRLSVTVLATGTSLLIGIPAGMTSLSSLGPFEGGRATIEMKPARGVEASESHASSVRFRREVFKRREKPVKPEPSQEEAEEAVLAAPAAPEGSIEQIIGAAATEFGLDPAYLIGVASCESGLDPSAYNEAGYHGLFQFDEQTWGAYGYGSIWDASAQSRTAARLIAAGEGSRWPNCA